MIPQKTYPEDYSCIISPKGPVGGLYIGNLQAAQNINTLQKYSIKAVLTAAKGVDLNHSKSLIPFALYIPADDHQSFNISTYFDKAADFIASALQKTNIMVHCLAGVSRSVSLVLSYFIKHRSYSYDEAFSLVKSKRRIIYPNDGFISQLKTYQANLRVKKESQRRGSPQLKHHYSASPQKVAYQGQVAPQVSDFRRSATGTSLKKHYSLKQTVNQQQQLQVRSKGITEHDYTKQQYQNKFYGENKYEVVSKDTLRYSQSFGRIKRISSFNVPNTSCIEKKQYDSGIFNTIQNKHVGYKLSTNVSDIDKKIEEIRKKYRQMSGYQMNFSGSRGLGQNRLNAQNNYSDRWSKQDNKKKDYKYFNQYDNMVKNRQYQYRPVSNNLYSRDQ